VSGGWIPQVEETIRRSISELIALHGLDRLLSEPAAQEKHQLVNDLRALRLVE
jgi:hypothetical protein